MNAAEFALQEMIRGLERQSNVLVELRQRASIVLSASGIVASLLGAAALRGDYEPVLALLALASTAAGMAACVAVLWTVRDKGRMPEDPDEPPPGAREWKVTVGSGRLLRLVREGSDPGELLPELRLARRVNYRTLERRSKRFVVACCLLVVQVVLWAATFLERTWP